MPSDRDWPTDARGRAPALARPARRVVSLAPSLTETVAALGALDRLVGRTRFCIHPEAVARVAVVGGTKDPDLARALLLEPDLVLANREENRAEDVAGLEERVPVFVTYPRRPADAAALAVDLGRLLSAEAPAATMAAAVERERVQAAAARALPGRRPRVVYLIWRRPYMTVTGDTYTGALLEEAGAENPFAAAPGRYPAVDEDALRAARADALLLASEPFHFRERHRQEALAGGLAPRVERVDGELLCWWGARTEAGLSYAVELVRRLRAGLAALPPDGVGSG